MYHLPPKILLTSLTKWSSLFWPAKYSSGFGITLSPNICRGLLDSAKEPLLSFRLSFSFLFVHFSRYFEGQKTFPGPGRQFRSRKSWILNEGKRRKLFWGDFKIFAQRFVSSNKGDLYLEGGGRKGSAQAITSWTSLIQNDKVFFK